MKSLPDLPEPSILEQDDFDRKHATALGELVAAQDRHARELNERGSRSRAHRQGVAVRQGYWVHAFQSWLREQLAAFPDGER